MSESPRTRTSAFALSLATGQGLLLLTTLVAFLVTPVIVHNLGTERFGLWRVLEVLLAWVALIPQCIAYAGSYLLVPLLAERDPARLRQFAGTLAVVGGIVAIVVSLAGLALAPILPWLAAAPAALSDERQSAYLIALLAGVPFAPLLLMRCVLDADQKAYLLNGVIAIQSLTVTVVAVWLAVRGNGLPGQAMAVAAGTAIQGVLFAFLAHQRYSWARVGWPTRTDTIRLLRRATGLLLLAFLGGVAARIEYPLVNSISGPQDTAHYFLGQKLFLVYASLVAVIGNSIWAPAADLFHRGESGRLIVQLDRALRGTAVVGTAGAVAIAGVTPTFLRLWLGEGFDPGSLARSGFAVSFPLLGLNVLLASVLTATGHTRAMLVSTATYFAVTVIAQCWLGQVAGPGGIAWGTAIGVGAAVAVNLAVASRVFGLSAIGAGMRLLMVALLGCCYGLGFATLLDLLPRMGWIELLAVMALGWGGFLMLAVQLILTREDRHEIHSRLFRR